MKIMKINSTASKEFNELLKKRDQNSYSEEEEAVNVIIENVKKRGDSALFGYTKKFDGNYINGGNVKVTEKEIKRAYEKTDEKLVKALKRAAENIESFHKRQLRQSFIYSDEKGNITGQNIIPLSCAGVYVPGGKASYPSTVLMNVIPAKVAGVKRIVMVSPADKNGELPCNTLVAAHIAGVNEIYKVGGAQAIAALAYGTESIPKVDKITGPGNIYVALAKKAVFGNVGIDSIAGPSEILVIADEKARPSYVAADLISQAEHDELAAAFLVTTSEKLALEVKDEIEKQTEKLKRKDIIKKSMDNYGSIITVPNEEMLFEVANLIAPEHLELLTENAFSNLGKIRNAGAVFIGEYSSEPLGDYMAGPNHTLPTNGSARFFSPLSVDDFIKKTSIISYTREGLKELSEDIMTIAKSEGLTGHASSIGIRFREEL